MMAAAGIVPAFIAGKRPSANPSPAVETATSFKLQAEPRAVPRADA